MLQAPKALIWQKTTLRRPLHQPTSSYPSSATTWMYRSLIPPRPDESSGRLSSLLSAPRYGNMLSGHLYEVRGAEHGREWHILAGLT